MHSESSKLVQAFLVILVFIIVTGGWEFYVWATETPAYVLPAPSVIGKQLWSLLGSSIFWGNFWVTMYEVLMGYLLGIGIAVVLGVLISQVKVLDLSLMPYIVAFQTIPSVALAPIFLQWFGYGLASKIVMAGLIAFFPMLVNVIAGLQASGRDEIQMLKAFGANRFQILMKVRVPNAMPYVFAGLGLSVVFALVGAQKGLGKMILQFNEQFNIAGMFAVLVVLAAIGMTMHSIVGIAKRRIVFWAGEH